MPAKAGIPAPNHLDSRPSTRLRTCFRGNDDEQKADFKSTN
jgi:hypothetical protein